MNYYTKNNGASQLNPKLGMYTTLMETILFYQDVMEEYSTHRTETMYNVGKRVLDEFTFDVYSVPQTVELMIAPNKTVAVPKNMITWYRMQVIDERGEVVDIVENKEISSLGARNNNRPQDLEYPDLVLTNDFYATTWGYYLPDNMPGAFGFGGTFNKYGSFKYDKNTGQLLLPSNFPYQKLVIDYMSNSANQDADGNYLVHVFAQDALMRRVDFEIKSYNTRKYSLGEVQLAEKYKDDAYGLMVSRFSSFSPEDFKQVITEQIKLAAKS